MKLYEIRIILFGELETAEGALKAIGDLFDEEVGDDNYGATLYEGIQGETTDIEIPADSPLIVTEDRSVDEILDAIEQNLDSLIESIEEDSCDHCGGQAGHMCGNTSHIRLIEDYVFPDPDDD